MDNVINSGGIKLIPEQIEEKLAGKIDTRFFIASKEDKELGEKVILVIEGEKQAIDEAIFSDLKEAPYLVLHYELLHLLQKQYYETLSPYVLSCHDLQIYIF